MTVIEVSALHKRYGRRTAVHDVSFTVDRGEIFGILGPNGAGKTTTAECVGGLRRPTSGSITVLGLDPQRDRAALRRAVGIQLQDSQLPDRMTVAEALSLYTSFYPDPADWRALLDDFGLAGQRGTEYRRLSGGQRQRLSIALALAGNPRVAILDELTTGLDPQARQETWRLVEGLRDRGVTVLLVTHLMEEAERLCDRLAVIDAGRVAATGTPASLVAEAGAAHRVRFRTAAPVDPGPLAGLPEVNDVVCDGRTVTVTGTGDLLGAVVSVLARHRIVAADLRYDQAGLDSAYLTMTSRSSTGRSEESA
jgi:ABC-2 type transport system ATP-binding protein